VRRSHEWWVTAPTEDLADPELIEDILQTLTEARVDTFVTLSPKTGSDAYGCTSAASCFVYDSEENQPSGFFPTDGQGFADESEDEDAGGDDSD